MSHGAVCHSRVVSIARCFMGSLVLPIALLAPANALARPGDLDPSFSGDGFSFYEVEDLGSTEVQDRCVLCARPEDHVGFGICPAERSNLIRLRPGR